MNWHHFDVLFIGLSIKVMPVHTPWESRHKASLVDAENYLLTCMHYIELNPLRAKMARHPAEYSWSSFRHNAPGEARPIITSHPVYASLGAGRTRKEAYLALFRYDIDPQDLNLIRNAARFSMPTGDNRFKVQIEQAVKRKLGYAKRGRPVKKEGGG